MDLDTNITPELEAEGLARDIGRRIQNLRKKSGLQASQRIELIIDCSEDLKNKIYPHLKSITDKVGADKVDFEEKETKFSSKEKAKSEEFSIGFDVK